MLLICQRTGRSGLVQELVQQMYCVTLGGGGGGVVISEFISRSVGHVIVRLL